MDEFNKLVLPGIVGEKALKHGSIYFVGTATTIINYGGFTILTDPNFLHAGDHAHLGYGLTSERKTNPAIEIDELPELDLCLLSHMHGDHWDHIASKHLSKTLPIVTTPHAAAELLKQGFINVHTLDTWDCMQFQKNHNWLRITSMPGKHAPDTLKTMLPPVMGSLLEWGMDSDDGRYKLYISGDTLVHEELHEIPKRYPGIDLALMHLGGTRVFGVLVTMNAKQGIEALRIIKPKVAIPIHYNDYDVFKSPLEDFVKAVEQANLDTKIHYLMHGDTYEFEVAAPVSRVFKASV